jgi:hypothetical protein
MSSSKKYASAYAFCLLQPNRIQETAIIVRFMTYVAVAVFSVRSRLCYRMLLSKVPHAARPHFNLSSFRGYCICLAHSAARIREHNHRLGWVLLVWLWKQSSEVIWTLNERTPDMQERRCADEKTLYYVGFLDSCLSAGGLCSIGGSQDGDK